MAIPPNCTVIMGINVYKDIPIPELVQQLKHAENDPDYPEAMYRALEKQKHSEHNEDNTVVSLF